MKRFVNHRIAISGIAVFLFLVVVSAASGQSASDKQKAKESNIRGNNYYEKGNYNQAITEFTEAIRLNPNYINAYSNRGLAYYRIKDFDHAIADIDKVIQLDPKFTEAYFYRGLSYYSIKDFDHAIADMGKAIQLDPKYTQAYNFRGGAYIRKNDFNRAIADLDKAIQLDPKYADAYSTRAWVYAYHLKKDFPRAISDANQAVNMVPNDAKFLGVRGWVYLNNGDYDKAIADFEKSLQIDSSYQILGTSSSLEGLTQARLARIVPEPVKDEDFEVKQNKDNTITITGYKGTARNVVIPDKLYGLKVTIIGNSAFKNKGLISVVIPDTVITIENGDIRSSAFLDNIELIKVTLGKGLKTIGARAFLGCRLTEIIIPDSVTSIGEYSFSAVGLIKITFGTGLQTIGEYAFNTFSNSEYPNQITEINLPSSLKEIGKYAFTGNKIQKLTLGNGLQTIGERAFAGNQIKELNFSLPSSLKIIENRTFASNQIQSVTIPNGITYISGRAFADNPLTTVVIPVSLGNGNIAGQSFGNIDGNTITCITIPAGMKEDTLKGIFEEAFVNFWINQNRAGGTYVKRGPIWTKE